MYQFGKRSAEKLQTCHKDLQVIMNLSLSRSKIDFGISEGYRTTGRQKELFDQGKSKIDGINKLGKHNLSPSEAVDIYTYHSDKKTRSKIAYDKSHLSYISGIIDSCVLELLEKGDITHKIRWGANWDSDGIIDFDQSFDDFPHFELLKL